MSLDITSYTLTNPSIDISPTFFTTLTVRIPSGPLSTEDLSWLMSSEQLQGVSKKKGKHFHAFHAHHSALDRRGKEGLAGLGISPLLDRETGYLRALALSSSHRAIFIRFNPSHTQRPPRDGASSKQSNSNPNGKMDILQNLLTSHPLYTFAGARICLLLLRDLSLHSALIDLSTLTLTQDDTLAFPLPEPPHQVLKRLWIKMSLVQLAKLWSIDDYSDPAANAGGCGNEDGGTGSANVILRAWLSYRAASEMYMQSLSEGDGDGTEWERVTRRVLDSRRLPNEQGSKRQAGPILAFFFDAVRIADQLEAAKPVASTTDFALMDQAFAFRESGRRGEAVGGSRFVMVRNGRFVSLRR
ncbi:hypothetical protein BT69DRAFT_1278542 [Atractiella rhizophila]|nr:hypothetical protein BT69DRAFT_1278542 [Atractiella rhizophila]